MTEKERQKYVDRGIVFDDDNDPSVTPTAMGGLYGTSGQDCVIKKYRPNDHDYSSDSSDPDRIDVNIRHQNPEVITAIRKTIKSNAKEVKQPDDHRLEIIGLSDYSILSSPVKKRLGMREDLTRTNADKRDRKYMQTFWNAFWQHRTRVETSHQTARILRLYAEQLSYRITCKKRLFHVIVSRE